MIKELATGLGVTLENLFNMLRCIFCGMCEEACPEDAIWLEKDYELSDYNRDAFIYTKDELLVPPEKSGYLPKR